MRFTELKENVSATDSEFDDLDYNKVDTALKSVGVALKDSSGQFRDLDDVFNELASKWDDLDRNTQRYIATTAAGSRQQSRFIAMMSDYDRTLELQEAAYNSVGQSTTQFNKYQDTVQYKINQIKNSWERLRVSLLNQDVYKKALDIGNNLLSSIKQDFSLKDLAFIGVIGLTIGKTFITQMIKGIQSNTNTMMTTIQSQMNNLANKAKLALSKIEIGNKVINIPFHIDTTVTEQEITNITNRINSQLSLLSSDIRSELLSINNQPINITGLAKFNEILKTGTTAAQLSKEQIIQLYQQMGQTGTITAGTQAFNNFKTQLQLIETELLKTAGNENLTAEQASNLRNQLQQLTIQTEQLSSAQIANVNSTSRMGRTFSIIGGAIGQNLGIGITTGLTTYLATGDLEQSLKSGLTSILTSVIATYLPQLISTLFSNPVTAAVTLAAVAITGIGALVLNSMKKDIKSQKELLLDEISDIEKKLEDVQEKVDTTTSTAKADKQAVSNMEQLKREWDELSQKQSLSTEEQERYNELIQQINDEYSGTIGYYNEMTNSLTINEQLWAKQLEEAKEIAALSADAAYNAQTQENSLNNQKTIAKNELSLLQAKETQGYTSTLTTDKSVSYQDLSQNMTSYEFQAINDVIKNGLTEYEQITESITKNYQDAITHGYVDANDNKSALINAQLANIKSYYDANLPNAEVDYGKILELIVNNDQSMIDFYQKKVLPYVGENDKVIEVIEEANNTIKDATAQYENNAQIINENNIAQQKQILQSALSEQTDSTRAQMVISTDTGKQLTEESANGDTTNVNEYLKNTDKFSRFSSTEAIIDEFLGHKTIEEAAKALNLSLEEVENIFGTTAEDYSTINEQYATDMLNSYVINEHTIDTLEAEANKIPQTLVDIMTELNTQATEMSMAEYQQEIDKLKNQYSSNVENIESGASLDYQNFANRFLTQNTEGQITGGFFSNLFTDKDIASQFVEMIQNGDFSAAQLLLVKNLGDDGKLLADILMNTDPATISSIQSFIADNFTGEEAQAQAQAGFQELLKKMTSGDIGLEQNELSILLNSGIDFSTNNPLSDDILMGQAAEALQSASNGTLSYEESLEKVKSVYPDLIQLVGEFQYGSESAFNTLLSGSQMAAEQLTKQSEIILDILDNYDTATGLSREQINQLKEAGLEDLYALEEETGTFQLKMSKITDLFAGNNLDIQNTFQKQLNAEQKNLNILKKDLQTAKMLGVSQETLNKMSQQYTSVLDAYNQHQKKAAEEIALIYQQNISLLQKLIDKTQELQDAADEAVEKVKDAQNAYNDALEAEKDAYDNISKVAQDADEAIQDAKDSANDAYDSWQDAIDAINDAEEALAEANKELYEAIHGTEDYTTGLDRMYNASRKIDTINKRMENLKETMNNATNSDDIIKATEDYINMAKEKVNVLTAMNQADQQTLNNMINDFLNNSSYDALKQFFRQTENGIEIDMQGIENADANDEIKNAAIEWAEQYNKIFDNILDRNDEISEAQKIMEDYYKTALDGYVNLQKKVTDILKENAEEEISITEEKYESMKEADDAYLDALESAIDKQRQLREQANQYENLATQEKKLSLLSRDTSGANQKQVLELQQEVKTSRTEMLDAEIDNFLESMRELYETQQEARDAEIEYLNALMESTNWWTKTNELLNSFETVDDYKTWLMENDTSFSNMSVEQQEQYLMEAETDYNAVPQFDAAKVMMEQWGQDLSVMIQADVEEVNRIVNELGIDTAIGEQILTAGEIARDEMIRTAEEAVAEKQQAVIDAQQTALDMEQAYYEALDAIKAAEEQKIIDVNDAQEEYLKACEDRAEKQKELSNALTAQEIANEELQRAQNELTAQQALVNELKAKAASIQAMQSTAETALQIIEDIERREVNAQQAVFEVVDGNGQGLQGGITYGAESIEEVIRIANDMGGAVKNVTTGEIYQIPSLLAYAQGGMVDYTGPAWVDGTKSQPEAFLDPEDTRNIAELTAVLSEKKSSSSIPFAREMISMASSFGNVLYPALSSIPASSNISNISTTNSSATSTNVEIHINVDSIANDYDVEQMLNVIEQRIYEVSNPVGSSVILQK